jgi:hypothetical protein
VHLPGDRPIGEAVIRQLLLLVLFLVLLVLALGWIGYVVEHGLLR